MARMIFNGGEMYSFECHINDECGCEVAQANMNVYAPDNLRAYLKGDAT